MEGLDAGGVLLPCWPAALLPPAALLLAAALRRRRFFLPCWGLGAGEAQGDGTPPAPGCAAASLLRSALLLAPLCRLQVTGYKKNAFQEPARLICVTWLRKVKQE